MARQKWFEGFEINKTNQVRRTDTFDCFNQIEIVWIVSLYYCMRACVFSSIRSRSKTTKSKIFFDAKTISSMNKAD